MGLRGAASGSEWTTTSPSSSSSSPSDVALSETLLADVATVVMRDAEGGPVGDVSKDADGTPAGDVMTEMGVTGLVGSSACVFSWRLDLGSGSEVDPPEAS